MPRGTRRSTRRPTSCWTVTVASFATCKRKIFASVTSYKCRQVSAFPPTCSAFTRQTRVVLHTCAPTSSMERRTGRCGGPSLPSRMRCRATKILATSSIATSSARSPAIRSMTSPVPLSIRRNLVSSSTSKFRSHFLWKTPCGLTRSWPLRVSCWAWCSTRARILARR